MRTDQFCDEECETNADGGKICGLVLDHSQHNDYQDQLGSEEHLNEKTLYDRGTTAQSGGTVQWAWKESANDTCCGNTADQLCREHK
jgi:hypothetical protein